MKRILTIILTLLVTISSQAVLKEKDLPHTLQILRTELTNYHRELTLQIEMNRKQSEGVRTQLMETMLRSNQNSLMLYSQKQDYVFDLTYACNEATAQYRQFQQQQHLSEKSQQRHRPLRLADRQSEGHARLHSYRPGQDRP